MIRPDLIEGRGTSVSSYYVEPILTATWLFPPVAVLFTLPYMVFQYRRYGAILLLRTVILYSFILYLMCAYFLTMLPLPTRELVASLTTPYLQLMPFQDVVTWIQKSGFSLQDTATWRGLIVNRDLFVMVANVAMTIPLGIYLRYYFGCSLRKTLLISLGVSLIFELTQLSALFGIYPRPYRLCETDDLITNTLGGAAGYWVAGWLTKILPTRSRMDAIAYRRGAHVSVTRRVTAAMVDWMLLGIVMLFILAVDQPLQTLLRQSSASVWLIVFAVIYIVLVAVYFILGEWLQKGLTVGKRMTHLRLVDERANSRPRLWQCAVRYSLLYFGFVPLPFVSAALFLISFRQDMLDWVSLSAGMLIMLLYMVCLVLVVIGVLNRREQLPHGALSQTRIVSTLLVTEDMLGRVGQTINADPIDDTPTDDHGPLLNG